MFTIDNVIETIGKASPEATMERILQEFEKDRITGELLKAAEASIKGNKIGFLHGLGRAGMIAQNAARAWFVDPRNGWAPDRPATIKRKLSKISNKKKRKEALENFQETLQAGGSMEGIDTPLIDSAQMRKAITHVIKEGK